MMQVDNAMVHHGSIVVRRPPSSYRSQFCHTRPAFDAAIDFYRVTHMHSADYAVARCLSVLLFTCLSVTRLSSVERVETYFQSFFTIMYPHHFSFSVPDGITILRWRYP